ncbi:FtsX-like permease family protein [Streptomyces sp. NPDC059688]|uniref:ABC transporter permease n=1 Tax=Streptomyces sp. NPDC059688 TaxID=3346906 RepID=UPI0036C4DFFA
MIDASSARVADRSLSAVSPIKAAADTLQIAQTNTTYRGADVYGRLVRSDGPKAPVPPGLTRLPAAGDMAASPALTQLLSSPGGALLRERLPYRITATISPAGLRGPAELAYYAGVVRFPAAAEPDRVTAFGDHSNPTGLNPLLKLLLAVGVGVLLVPVGVVISTAVRFGGERRDRRLAALRLIGADLPTIRRIAVGETLTATLLGLATGSGLFLLLRRFTARVTPLDLSFYPSDVTPTPWLTVLVLLAALAVTVAVTLSAMRAVGAEPLGVVRQSGTAPGNPLIRFAVPSTGLAMLLLPGTDTSYWSVLGAVLTLGGIAAAIPWLLRAAVRPLRGGPVPWQLAIRRLQLTPAPAARLVSGIAIIVAGIIALQTMANGVQSAFTTSTGQDPARAQLAVHTAATRPFRVTPGVRSLFSLTESKATNPLGSDFTQVTVGDCAALRQAAAISHCTDAGTGSVFIVPDTGGLTDVSSVAFPGATLNLNYPQGDRTSGPARLWQVPATARIVGQRTDPGGDNRYGVFATPTALAPAALKNADPVLYLRLDPRTPDAVEHARNTAARLDPAMAVTVVRATVTDHQFTDIRTGLTAAALLTLALIGMSLLITTLEQLRERKRLFAALAAFGTSSRTLSLSVLCQAAVPVFLGLTTAAACGVTLGAALLTAAGRPVRIDWPDTAATAGFGAAVVLAVTVLSLPTLRRMTRADGLHMD